MRLRSTGRIDDRAVDHVGRRGFEGQRLVRRVGIGLHQPDAADDAAVRSGPAVRSAAHARRRLVRFLFIGIGAFVAEFLAVHGMPDAVDLALQRVIDCRLNGKYLLKFSFRLPTSSKNMMN
jgi:hypothetical protein